MTENDISRDIGTEITAGLSMTITGIMTTTAIIITKHPWRPEPKSEFGSDFSFAAPVIYRCRLSSTYVRMGEL
jgi:hypothetical protein